MTYLEASRADQDPLFEVFHGVFPDTCGAKAGTPVGNGIYHNHKYGLSGGVEVSLNKATYVASGLELEIGIKDHTEKFLIPKHDIESFLSYMNLNPEQLALMKTESASKPDYEGIKLTAFLNKYNENKLFGLIALTRKGEDLHIYEDRFGKSYMITYLDRQGI